MVDPGKELRLGNVLADDGRTVTVAMDHGGYAGPMEGIRDIGSTIETVTAAGADAVLLTPGMVRNNAERLRGDVGVVLRVDSTGSTQTEQAADPYPIIDVEEALALGVDGVIAMGYLEGDNEVESLSLLTRLANDCSRHGMPLVAEMLPMERGADPDAVELAARIGSEYGADLIKTYYTGDEDSFRGVVEGTPTDVVMLGGPKRDSTRAVLEDVERGVRAGAVGIAMGRNIWQADDPARMVSMMRGIVHDGRTAEEVLEAGG